MQYTYRRKIRKEQGSIEGIFLGIFGIVFILLIVVIFSKGWFFPPLASDRIYTDESYKVYLIVTCIFLILAKGGWSLLAWLFRAREDRKAEYLVWSKPFTIAVVVILVSVYTPLYIKAMKLWSRVFVGTVPKDAVEIQVVAQQFEWNFRFPGKDGKFGRTSPNLIKDNIGNFIGLDYKDPNAKDDIVLQREIFLPVNKPVVISLTSRDVIHSFFVPHFRIKQDAVPGMITKVWFTPTQIGKFEIACAELCGLGHYKMRGIINVVSEEEFQKWLNEQK